MQGRFVDELDQLERDTPDHVTGVVEVNQIYAHYQHAHPEFHHPRGGQAFYLRDPLFIKTPKYMENLARSAMNGNVARAMEANMEDLSKEVFLRAPWEFNALRNSAHPTVTADGHVIYDRPPVVPRLSEIELKLRDKLRYLEVKR